MSFNGIALELQSPCEHPNLTFLQLDRDQSGMKIKGRAGSERSASRGCD
jgi:hypothetical protein